LSLSEQNHQTITVNLESTAALGKEIHMKQQRISLSLDVTEN